MKSDWIRYNLCVIEINEFANEIFIGDLSQN